MRMLVTRSRKDGPGGTEELVITGQGNKSDLPDNRKEGKLPSPFNVQQRTAKSHWIIVLE